MKSSDAENRARICAAQSGMAKAGLGALLIRDRANTFYLSGFTGTASTIVLTPRGAFFETDSRYLDRVRGHLDGYKILGDPGAPRGWAALIARRKPRLIGFEGNLPYAALAGIRRQVRPARMRPCRVVEDARMVKSADEIDRIEKAQRVAEDVYEAVLAGLCPGVTERQVRNRILALLNDAGADGPSFPPIVAFGPHSALPHHEFTDRALRKRDVVLIDMGAQWRGYCSDMTRTVFVGPPTAKMREIYGVVLEAQERALAAVAPGRPGGEIDRAARERIAAAGHARHFGHGTGHGVGIEIHEGPSLGAPSRAKLAPGMCVTVEPGIYLVGQFGVRIEDQVVVTADGRRNLTRAPKQLRVLTLKG